MIGRKKTIIYTALVGILYSYTSTVYLGNYYRITHLLSAEEAELIMMRMGYFLQALGMFLYSALFKKYNSFINSPKGCISLIALSIVPMCLVQNTINIPILIVSSFVFNILVGMILEMYLVELAHNVPKNNLGICYGIAYAFGSIFTFLVTYFDGGMFMESPKMTIIYILMVTLSAILLLKNKSIKQKEPSSINHNSKRLILYLSLFIIGGSIVTGLGDGIYNFGRWGSDADIRVVKSFYAFGLIFAGYLSDKNRRYSAIITVTFLSYYIISAFLLDNIISASIMMSLGYFFMSFISVYRYMMVVDFVDEHPQFIGCEGYGLMVSRVAEGLTSLFMMIFPLSLTNHVIVTLLFYAPLIVISIVVDSIKYEPISKSDNTHFIKLCEKYNLTSREEEICRLILENATDDEIANSLYISKSTVRFHISNILKKTNCKNRVKIKNLFNKLQ